MSNLPVVTITQLNEIQGTTGASLPPPTAWTPTIQIVYATSELLKGWDNKEDGPKPEPGEFWMGQKNGKNLHKSFVAVPLSFRDHALQTGPAGVTAESFSRFVKGHPTDPMPVSATPDQQVFNRIESGPKSEKIKDGTGKEKDHLNRWGNDVLLWIPEHKCFAQIFLHSTNRQCVSAYVENLGKFVRVRSFSPPSAQYTWYLAECRPIADVSTLDPAKETFLPSNDASLEEVTKFKNPKNRNEQGATPTGVDGRPR